MHESKIRHDADTVAADYSGSYERVTTSVLVIGAGAAGARAAIELQESGITPLVISKRDHGDAHTTWARGGINAALGVLDSEDNWAIHAADTLDEGHYINDPTAVEMVTRNMPDRIRELDDWGMDFSRTDNGDVNQRYFGAQSFRRTCFAGDHTGESLLDTLVDKAQSLDIPYRDNVMVTHLLSDGDTVYGAAAYDMEDGHFIEFVADRVILAAGGNTAVYDRHSSREEENNGDGVALAADAGAKLMDMEFIQFHPTGMVGERYGEEWDGRLVTEAVRGEGGRLYNADGERFMERYSPDQMELDARDVVARAIEQEVREGRGTENGGVYLDISHRDRDFIKERLPRMYERFQSLDVDIAEEPMEVAPTAHYAMGGVDFDAETGATGVDNLHVIGETTAGVHGANRLGGNSLAETVAIGQLVGDHIASVNPDKPNGLPEEMHVAALEEFGRLQMKANSDGTESVHELIADLGQLLENYAGIRRTEERLTQGLSELATLRKRAEDLAIDGDMTSVEFEFALDLEFMFTTAEAILRGARMREESRGAHYRDDYTERDSSWQENILYTIDENGFSLERRGVEAPSEAVQKELDAGHELDYHHLE